MRFASNIHSYNRLTKIPLAGSALLMMALAGCAAHPAPTSMAAPSSHLVIVRLVGRHDTVTITTGPVSPLYTIADESGRVLVSEMTLSDLKKTRPDLYETVSLSLAPEADAADAR